MLRKYDVVFFDMGSTLVGFHPSLMALTLRIFREAGIPVSPGELGSAWQAVDAEFSQDSATATFEASEAYDNARELEYRRRILARLGIRDEDTLQRLRKREKAVYAEPGVIRPYPEVRMILKELRTRGYRLGIISNWSWNLRQRCEQVGIADDFDLILASAYAGCVKPNPAIFRQALDSLQVRPEHAIHVGDNYRADVLGAQSAGLDAILIYRDEGSPNQDPPFIRTLEDLLPVLEG